jgi:hypothetical protein
MTKLTLKTLLLSAALYPLASFAQDKPKTGTAPAPLTDTAKAKKPAGIADKIKTSKKIDGLFTLYQDTATGSIQLFVKKSQLAKEFIYQSFSISGPTSLFLNQSMHRSTLIFSIKKTFDKLEFAIANTGFYYDKNNPVSKTAGVDIPESVFLMEKVAAEDENGYLIPADGLFISEKLDPVKPIFPPGIPPGAIFNLGNLNSSKSKYHTVRSFPNNTDIVVDLAYDNPVPFNQGGPDITDARYVRVRMQHTFLEVPKNDFRARRADPRVGFFGPEINDQTSISPTPFKDIIDRWHLKKKDPAAAISEPVEPIVWWVENTTPIEYRQTIVEAGLKWNEAFEKAGFKNAVVMNIQPDNCDWDPADIRYNVIRWVSSAQPSYGAIGPNFSNPRTGQVLGSDITVEWYSGSASPIFDELFTTSALTANNSLLNKHFHADGRNCTLASELKAQFLTGLTVAEANNESVAEISEVHKQFLYYLIMHEMGHTMGLNHNMKSSQLWKPSEIHNKELTRKIGLIGSVMDYPAVNVSSDRAKQGDYYTTRVGPYDLWAIEYGYTECTPDQEEALLNKILSRSTDPQLAFGNDADDMRSPGKAIDPRVMVNDLSGDAVAYAEDRLKLVNSIMTKIKTKYSKPGQSYAELRTRYNVLNGQRFSMISSVSRYIGGIFIDRSFVGQNTPNKPFTPVPLAQQKKAMEVLSKYVFAPDAFANDEQLFPYLQFQRRGFNFFSTTEDPKLTSGYLGLQSNAALAHILHPVTLQRITNTRLYGNQYSVAEVMSDLTKGIFGADMAGKVNVYRQYLQTQFVKGAAAISDVKGSGNAYDEVSKAAARNTLRKIKTMMATAVSPDEDSRTHRSNLVFLIDNALSIK